MRPVLAVVTLAFAVSFAEDALSGNSQYDMNRLLSEPNPLAGTAYVPPPTFPAMIKPISDRPFTGRLYDLDAAVRAENPLRDGLVRPVPVPVPPRPTAARAEFNGPHYDMYAALNAPNPLRDSLVRPVPVPVPPRPTAARAEFGSRLYDMNAALGAVNPIAAGAAIPAVATTSRPTLASGEFAGTLYDMNAALGRPYPLESGFGGVPGVQGGVANRPATASLPAPALSPAPATTATESKMVAENKVPNSVPEKSGFPALSDVDSEEIGLGPQQDVEVNDPLEPLNRFFFGFNEALMTVFIGPVARTYNAYVPEPVRTGIRNFFGNLDSPITLANDLLQFEFKRAGTTVTRTAINTTIGVLGFIDVAEKWGYEKHEEDFGQTLGAWGVGELFYLVLPIYGPSNPRDAVGKFVVDPYFDPLGWYLDSEDQTEAKWGRVGMSGLVTFADLVDEIDELRASSVDFYGAMRSLYRQKRAADIANGESQENIPDFDIQPAPPGPARP